MRSRRRMNPLSRVQRRMRWRGRAAYADGMSSDDKPGAASEETKRKFREALERKKQQAQDRPGHLDGEGTVHEAHGRAEKKREFRRKSG